MRTLVHPFSLCLLTALSSPSFPAAPQCPQAHLVILELHVIVLWGTRVGKDDVHRLAWEEASTRLPTMHIPQLLIYNLGAVPGLLLPSQPFPPSAGIRIGEWELLLLVLSVIDTISLNPFSSNMM